MSKRTTERKPEPQKLTLPLSGWLRIQQGLMELCSKNDQGRDKYPLPVVASFRIGRLIRQLEPVVEQFVKERDKRVKEYAENKADEKPTLEDVLKPLMDEVVEFDFSPMAQSEIGNLAIGAGTAAALQDLFTE